MSDKVRTFLGVVFLTLLIWAWAYLSQEEKRSFTGTLEVSPATDPGLLVTFTGKEGATQTRITLTSLNFKGAPSKISDLLKRYNLPQTDPDKERLNFYYNPTDAGQTSGTYTLDILDYLRKSPKMHELALTLESCTPEQAEVTIEQLEEKKLAIQCLDENGLPVKGAVADPAFVNIFVRKGYSGPATVTLSPLLKEAARSAPVTVTPYVSLGVAKIVRESKEPVKVSVQSEELLKTWSFQTTKPIGIIMSQALQNRYKVTIQNEIEVRTSTPIVATEEAFRAYENVTYPLLIEILDRDAALPEIPPKRIIYNFPPEYVKRGEIALDETKIPRTATIKLEPINPLTVP
ncbi:MAG TPA: hypothetical protein PK052_03305 [Anaerohalosphaeraceae bacterium]|nr:hypothetical protein [Phycisphaerae bacterium]HOK94861.1 hypothetical protein [Anaerohalosphaeraceae bacterium]HOL30987.1 hypothetical protein [Anaerohalosphaeraceae bacterium]HOM76249.1 hypothetical protein [Anaerohalosphaeraceae bacterium]HPC63368.1 hypothetical protein [Anaerohalosphaeraceae bacterium]